VSSLIIFLLQQEYSHQWKSYGAFFIPLRLKADNLSHISSLGDFFIQSLPHFPAASTRLKLSSLTAGFYIHNP
jgi:hypothetical protein